MRLFVALDVDDPIRAQIARFLDETKSFAPNARWTNPESLHVTLKFIGEQPESRVEEILHALRDIKSTSFDLRFRGCGFFPNPRAARVFWLGIVADSQLASLASEVNEKLAGIGISKEPHAFKAHLTLARGKGRSGSPRKLKGDGPARTFQKLQEKLSTLPVPDLGTMTVREFFLYRSVLSPAGSIYTKLAASELG